MQSACAVLHVLYTGNGTAPSLSVPFPYLLQTHVRCFLGYDLLTDSWGSELVSGTDFTWTSGTQIQLLIPLASGTQLTVIRKTPTSQRLVDWSAASNLLPSDLDSADLQNFYALQEQEDRVYAAAALASATESAIDDVLLYSVVANVAGIPASPAVGDRVEVSNSTGIQSFTPLSGVPVGFVGSSSVRVRLVYSTNPNTWQWVSYFATDPDGRYVQKSAISSSANSTSTTTVANSQAVKTAKDAADAAQVAANTAQSAASTAQSAANAAQSSASNAQSSANAAQATATDAQNLASLIRSAHYGPEPALAMRYPYMAWADVNNNVMKMRNGANTAWVELFRLDGFWNSLKIVATNQVTGPVLTTESPFTALVANDPIGVWEMVSNDSSTNANGSRVRIIGTVNDANGAGRIQVQVKAANSQTWITQLDVKPTRLDTGDLFASYVYAGSANFGSLNGSPVTTFSVSLSSAQSSVDTDISSAITASAGMAQYLLFEIVGIHNNAGAYMRMHKDGPNTSTGAEVHS